STTSTCAWPTRSTPRASSSASPASSTSSSPGTRVLPAGPVAVHEGDEHPPERGEGPALRLAGIEVAAALVHVGRVEEEGAGQDPRTHREAVEDRRAAVARAEVLPVEEVSRAQRDLEVGRDDDVLRARAELIGEIGRA